MNPELVLVGGGGHCRSCIDVIEAEGRYKIAGVVDLPENRGQRISGYEVIGSDVDLEGLAAAGRVFLITLGQIMTPRRRMEIFAKLDSLGATFATVVSPAARVARTAHLGRGTIVMHHALVVTGAVVGDNCIVNDKALIEHDARVENHCHISTAAVLNGAATVGEGVFVGSGAIVNQGVAIAAGCVIGSGSVVRRAVTATGTYTGDPFRKRGNGEPGFHNR